MTIRVIVADDHAMIRAGLSALLDAQDDVTVVGQAVDGEEAIALATREKPDVVMMDVRMPVLDGIAATERIVSGMGGEAPRILMLTTFAMDEYIYDALRAGASGFLLKDALPDDLVAAVRTIALGESLLAPAVTKRLIELYVEGPVAPPRDLGAVAALTEREREILTMMGQGLANAEIAVGLYIAEQTVKTHVSRIFAKLGVRDRVQAVILAYDAGLVVPRA